MNKPASECENVEEYARENREQLVNVLRHSGDERARAYAWTLLDAGLSDPEFVDLQQEFDSIKQQREVA